MDDQNTLPTGEEMDPKEEKLSEDGTTVSPTTEDPGMPKSRISAEEETKDTAGMNTKEGLPEREETQENPPAEDGVSAELQEETNGLPEVKVMVESQKEDGEKEATQAELVKEDDGKEDTTAASQEMTGGKEEIKPESKEAEGNEPATQVSEKQEADEKGAKPQSAEKVEANDRDRCEQVEDVGKEALDKEAKTESQKQDDIKDEAQAKPPEVDGKEETRSEAKEFVEPGEPTGEQEQDTEKESEEGAVATPSSPEEWPESPTEEGHSLSSDGLGPDSTASGETSPSASESSDVPQSPTEPTPSGEKKKERAPERRVSAPVRPRGPPRAQNRKAILDKFGGAASGPTALFRNTKAAGAAIGGVKNMLLEWCRAMTRNYEHVDIQNFSSSWSSGMAFCALIHKFFPDAFDYAALDPTKRRHNFTLAFSTAEKLADCAQLLEVDDMVRLAVPDSKCVYTYIQELYRSLVQKGLVKTKKK